MDYVLNKEAGSSDNKFQNNWMRDCDPKTGKVLESRQVDDPEAPGGPTSWSILSHASAS